MLPKWTRLILFFSFILMQIIERGIFTKKKKQMKLLPQGIVIDQQTNIWMHYFYPAITT